MLLVPEREDGRTLLRFNDKRSLTATGSHSVMSTYHKEVMESLGFFADGELVEADVDQEWTVDLEAGVVEIVERIEIPDDHELQELLEDAEQTGAERAAPTAD